MSLPYENATSGDKAIGEMQKILRGFGVVSNAGKVSFRRLADIGTSRIIPIR